MNSYPSTTTEYIPISVTYTVNGVPEPILDSVAFLVVPRTLGSNGPGAAPSPNNTSFVTATSRTIGTQNVIGIEIEQMSPGVYDVWARITSAPDNVIRYAGAILLT